MEGKRVADDVEYAEQGWIEFKGYRLWYGIVGARGTQDAPPLLTVHGGPGLNHQTLEPIAAVAESGHPVIFYDQLGCGASSRPAAGFPWNRSLFLEELDAVRAVLRLDHVHLFGHSYGGALCLDYVLSCRPAGLISLTLSDSFASVPALAAGWERIRQTFPADVQRALLAHEAAGTTDSAEYGALRWQYFISRHVCTVSMSERMMAAVNDINDDIYRALHGPSWFEPTGEYGQWDVTDRLREIVLPTLILAGRADQCVPSLSEEMHARISGSQLAIIEDASHLPFIERPDAYFPILTAFLRSAESEARDGVYS